MVGLFERHGTAGALWRLMALLVPVAVGIPVFVGLGLESRYLSLPLDTALVAAGIISCVLVAATAWGLLSFRADVRAIASGDPGALLRFPTHLVRAVLGRIVLMTLPALMVVYAVAGDDWTLLGLAETAVGAIITIVTGALAGYAAASTMAGIIANAIGLTDRPSHSDLGLSSRLAISLAVLTISSGSVVGALTVDPGDPGGLMRTYGLAAAMSAVFLLAVSTPITMSVRNPVRHLIAGARAVTAGDLGARVPVTTADELGELAATFNSMIGSLQVVSDGLKASRARVVVASDQARRRVERDLHDGAQQSLLLLNLKLGVIQRQLESDPVQAAELLREARSDLGHALEELRDLAHGVYPEILASDGVPTALNSAGGSKPPIIEARSFGRYATEIEAAIYFCCLEAIQNASKHAGATAQVRVVLSETASDLHFEVVDDGLGFNPLVVKQDGFQNMSDRIGALGGTVEVDSVPGRGTRISGSVPFGAPDRPTLAASSAALG
jgi:signal transduction histidine kinase